MRLDLIAVEAVCHRDGGAEADQRDAGSVPFPRGLFDSVFHEVDEPIAIVAVVDDQPVIVDVNTQFERWTGIALDDARGRNLMAWLSVPSDGAESEMDRLGLAFRRHAPATARVVLKCGDSASVAARVTARPCATSTPDSRFVCIFRLEEAMVREQEEERAAREITGRLLTFLSHDLRTPLNGILGFSEIMMSDLIGHMKAEDYKAYARDIHHSGQDLLRLVNGLLDLGDVRAGGLEMSDGVFAVGDCLEVCLDAVAARACEAGVAVRRRLARALPRIRGDEGRFRQAIILLLANAIGFTRRGGLVSLSATVAADGGVRITCRDSGTGIADNELRCAFRPHRRIEDTYTNPRAGIGAGLPLVKVLIEQHGGEVMIASRAGQGTTIRLVIPGARTVRQASRQ